MGWLRFPYKPDTVARTGPHSAGKVLVEGVRGLQHAVLHRNHPLNADFLCGLPTSAEFGAYVGKNIILEAEVVI